MISVQRLLSPIAAAVRGLKRKRDKQQLQGGFNVVAAANCIDNSGENCE